MIRNLQQSELAEAAIRKRKRFLLTVKEIHSPEAYAVLSAPILLELQARGREMLRYLRDPVGRAMSTNPGGGGVESLSGGRSHMTPSTSSGKVSGWT